MSVRDGREVKRMAFERVLSADGAEVVDASLEWAPRKVSVPVGDGTSAVEEVEVYAPAAWSDRAVTIAASKYMRRAVGRVDGSSAPSQQRETHLGKVVLRIVNAIAQAGVRQGYFGAALIPATLPCGEAELPSAAQVFRDELYVVLLRQYAAFNSPVWFNCGLFEAYGAYSDGSNFAWSETGTCAVRVDNAYARPQCSACFIQSVDDSIESIYGLIGTEAKLFKHGSGTGTNFSTIRGKDEPLSGGGRSSGLMSFLHAFDAGAGALKSGGVTRRAAKMVCLDLDHPEIGAFVTWKAREEKKARALIAAGYSADFEGEAYRTVSGQNSNTSVRISDAFMEALLDDAPEAPVHTTILRTTGAVCEQMSVCDLWKSVCDSAWECGDPGVQFADTIDEWNVVPSFGRIRASNPCGEFLFLDDTACNLASINLAKVFAAPSGPADPPTIKLFEHIVRLLITAQDILVDYSSYPTAKIAENSHKFRPLGLGYADLGGWLMSLGIPYDSDEARALAASVTSLMTAAAYSVSRELADVVGQGPWLRADIECAQADLARIIQMHAVENKDARRMYRARIPGHIGDAFFERADAKWRFLCELRDLLFVRNAQVTVIAPTGTIGLLMDCDATGIEPVFALCTHKKLAGGGSMSIPCRAAAVALASPKLYHRCPGPAFIGAQKHVEQHGTIVGVPGVPTSLYPIFDTASEAGGRCISADGHLKMVAAIQPFVSGGISKTINLPESATPEDIGRIYESAWRVGIKSITVYRDKSKGSQPLQSQQSARSDEAKSATSAEQSAETARPLRRGERERVPRIRDGKTLSCKIDGVDVDFRTGEYEDGRVCEVFIDGYKSGGERSKQDAFAVAVSLGLQCGVPLAAYVRQFENMHFAPSGLVTDNPYVKTATSPYDLIFRTLAAMYPDGKRPDKSAAPIVVNVAIDGERVRAYGLSAQSQADNAHRAPRTCAACGGAMLPSGACYTCTVCGANTGCG